MTAKTITITLMNTSSAHNVVHKQMTTLKTITGTLKEDTFMENIVTNVEYFSDYYQCNYAYIPEFHRYYYVRVELIDGAQVRLIMKSDALTSFYDGYKNSKIIAKRSSTNCNPNIVDTASPFKPQPKVIHRRTNFGFTPSSSGYCYVLTVGGK